MHEQLKHKAQPNKCPKSGKHKALWASGYRIQEWHPGGMHLSWALVHEKGNHSYDLEMALQVAQAWMAGCAFAW